jgi:putative sigma-54 modulation protein
MKLNISFKHLDHTPALDERIKEKSEKFSKFFEGNISVQWVCSVHQDKHWAEIKIHGPKFDFFAKASADNMYKALDVVVAKMERQIERQKNIMRNRIHASATNSPKHQEIQRRIKDEWEAYEEWEERSA